MRIKAGLSPSGEVHLCKEGLLKSPCRRTDRRGQVISSDRQKESVVKSGRKSDVKPRQTYSG